MQNYDPTLLNKKEQMYKNAYSIIANYHKEINKDYKEFYKKFITEFNNTKPDIGVLKESLINYRKSKSREKNIPAYFIFTNEELDKILENLPKSEKALKDSKILSDVKIKLHGKEIIDIINNNY